MAKKKKNNKKLIKTGSVMVERRIGFRTHEEDEIEFQEMQQINNTENEEDKDDSTVMLNDYIPGAVYDANGNIITKDSFNANIKKVKAEARNLNWIALAKLILYTSISTSIALLSYGVYKKYLDKDFINNKIKSEIICNKK